MLCCFLCMLLASHRQNCDRVNLLKTQKWFMHKHAYCRCHSLAFQEFKYQLLVRTLALYAPPEAESPQR